MKQKIYEMLRKYVARRATNNLGKVEITDDEIICYVDGKKLKKEMKERYLNRYNIVLKSIPFKEEIYKICHLDKPVHYIIGDVDFDREIVVMASTKNCYVTFENCKFKTFVGISFADHITFKNNIYEVNDDKYIYSLIPYGEFHMSTRNVSEVNKIEFINDKIMVDDTPEVRAIRASDVSKELKNNTYKKGIIEMWLYAKEISFIDSDIINAESLELNVEKIIMENSNLDVNELSVYTEDIMSSNSYINTDVADINSGKDDVISQIQGINIDYNSLFVDGIEVNKNTAINKQTLELQQKRLELISVLKRIGNKCHEEISMQIKSQPLKRVLKK